MKKQIENKKRWVHEQIALYESELVRYGFYFVKNIEVARDIVQETFLKLWQQDRDQIKSYTKAWLFRVCRNRCLDHLKKEKPMISMVGNNPKQANRKELRVEDQTSMRLEAEQTNNHLHQQVAKLDPKYQEVIRLKFQNEMSYKQIAEVTGNSTSYVGVLLHEGIKSLRSMMQPSIPKGGNYDK